MDSRSTRAGSCATAAWVGAEELRAAALHIARGQGLPAPAVAVELTERVLLWIGPVRQPTRAGSSSSAAASTIEVVQGVVPHVPDAEGLALEVAVAVGDLEAALLEPVHQRRHVEALGPDAANAGGPELGSGRSPRPWLVAQAIVRHRASVLVEALLPGDAPVAGPMSGARVTPAVMSSADAPGRSSGDGRGRRGLARLVPLHDAQGSGTTPASVRGPGRGSARSRRTRRSRGSARAFCTLMKAKSTRLRSKSIGAAATQETTSVRSMVSG